ncbi:GTPase IMAP family member 7-like [Parambassis ranga]|uniref:GTPase IMAP family member 7-like n=1 Tax=Parambassis ranga TaxID=210632 RepID=A0A6P7IDX4_9TELE|nr:GTPase IMAP family member 7-like [Parambassis ranga]
MSDSDTRRIVILGKTGSGKSSLANTIFKEQLFNDNPTLNSGTKKCRAETRTVKGRRITLIDTPGFFDTDIPEEKLKPEILRCIIECSPGPHAFLIVFKMEKITLQEQEVIKKISEYFSEEAFKYATVVFTHGEQLPKGQKIEDLVQQNKYMSELVRKCGGRCHIIDNKYWNGSSEDEYRTNTFQVKKLLETINKTVKANNGNCYTTELLQAVEQKIQQQERCIAKISPHMSKEETREKAKSNVFHRFLVRATGVVVGALFGAYYGGRKDDAFKVIFVLLHALHGAVAGYHAVEEAETVWEAVEKAAEAVKAQ